MPEKKVKDTALAPTGAGAVVLDDPQADALKAMVRGTMAAGIFTDDLPIPAIEAACGLALALGLDPVQGDVVVFTTRKNIGTRDRAQWVVTHTPYVVGAALAKWVAKFPNFKGYEERILKPEEKAELMIDTGALAVETTLYRADWVNDEGKMLPIRGIGTANPAKPFRNNAIEKDFPYDMACWRSLRRAVARGFPTDTSLGRKLLSEDFTVIEVQETTTAAVADLPAPDRIPDDIWQGFYQTMTDWGVSHDRAHTLLEEAGYTIEKAGGRSIRHTNLQPHEAAQEVRSLMVAMGVDDPDPDGPSLPEPQSGPEQQARMV